MFTARNRRGFVDAPLALGDPNEEPTPVEMLLAALLEEQPDPAQFESGDF